MKYELLGENFKREGFRINEKYRGINRNSIPYEEGLNEGCIELLKQYHQNKIDKKTQNLALLYDIFKCISNSDTNKFEIVLVSTEEIKDEQEKEFLGYDAIEEEQSLIYNVFKENQNIESKHYSKLNSNFLFQNRSDCLEFCKEFNKDFKPVKLFVIGNVSNKTSKEKQ